MPQEVFRQGNFTSGELDPKAIGRRDIQSYLSSLARAENHLPTAQGPIVRRPGLAHVDLIRNTLEAVSELDAATVTAPNGGTVAGLTDGNGFETTTDLGAVDGYVLAEFDFGSPVTIGLIDVEDFMLVAAGGGAGSPAPPQYPWSPYGQWSVAL